MRIVFGVGGVRGARVREDAVEGGLLLGGERERMGWWEVEV